MKFSLLPTLAVIIPAVAGHPSLTNDVFARDLASRSLHLDLDTDASLFARSNPASEKSLRQRSPPTQSLQVRGIRGRSPPKNNKPPPKKGGEIEMVSPASFKPTNKPPPPPPPQNNNNNKPNKLVQGGLGVVQAVGTGLSTAGGATGNVPMIIAGGAVSGAAGLCQTALCMKGKKGKRSLDASFGKTVDALALRRRAGVEFGELDRVLVARAQGYRAAIEARDFVEGGLLVAEFAE